MDYDNGDWFCLLDNRFVDDLSFALTFIYSLCTIPLIPSVFVHRWLCSFPYDFVLVWVVCPSLSPFPFVSIHPTLLSVGFFSLIAISIMSFLCTLFAAYSTHMSCLVIQIVKIILIGHFMSQLKARWEPWWCNQEIAKDTLSWFDTWLYCSKSHLCPTCTPPEYKWEY